MRGVAGRGEGVNQRGGRWAGGGCGNGREARGDYTEELGERLGLLGHGFFS